ncbi:RHS repeat-associated core domain [Frankia torreyi]|uniref:RHS repeat-associated core domain n=2 Tax=Frankia TaxID=1854 RepID=A0A0D8BJK6_9ACTN|nr:MULTISPECIES: DUF6531 domain-containing protein [Frankia]KJE24240.1 RHS repeat-associated core domain [Frankia torreyi]
MATSSADPEDLGTYVTDATAARTTLATAATGVRAYYDDVVTRFGAQYSLSHPDLWAKLSSHLSNAEERDRFVGTVKDAFVAADGGSPGGMVTVADSQIASGLRAAGIGALPTVTLTVDDPVLLGRPPDSGFAVDPVCTANGNFVEQELDLPLPGRAGVAGWRRTYNSRGHDRVGAHGPGWCSWADTALELSAELVGWRGPDGAELLVERPSAGRPTAMPRLGAMLHADGSGFRFERGPAETWWYDEAGRPVRVRTGPSEITLEWAGSRLVQLRHPRSDRSVLLEWNHTGTLITTARASDGRAVSYCYDDDAQLVAVDGGPHGPRRYRCLGGMLVAIVDADGVTLARNSYDEAGRVLTQLAPEGRLVRFGYGEGYRTLVTDAAAGAINEYRHDAAGRLICVIDDADRVFHRVFDDAGQLRGIQERSGARWAMDYDDAGNLTSRTGPCGIRQQWTWDDHGRMTSHTDPGGQVTRWLYAGGARTPVEIVDATGAVTRITVSDDDLPICVADPDGVTTRFAWDGDGQLTRVAVAGAGRTRLRYDAAGRLVEMIGPDGDPRRWETDDAGRVVLEQAPGGARSRFHHTAAGRPDGYVDPAGGRWSSTYGTHGRVAQVTDPLGSTVGFSYDLFGNTSGIVAPDGQTFGFDHDGLGRLVAARDPAGATFSRAYDPDGRPTLETDGDGNAWQITYDEAGRPTERTAPDGRTWHRAYDPAGSVIAETDPAGATTHYDHDPRGRVVAVTDPAGGRRALTWTPGGRLASVTSPLGRTVTYGYDRAGRLAQTLSVSGARTVYRHDPAGRLTALVTPAGRETRWEHDPQGAVSAVIRPDGRRMTIERDPLGLPVTVTDADGAVRRYTYDARGALTSATDPLGAVTSYEYDVRGRLRAWTDPLGGRYELRYDQVGRQIGMTDPLGRPTTVTRDRNGAVDTLRYADGTGLRWWRDPGGRLIGRGLPGSEQPQVRYSYDPAGRLTRADPASPAPDRPELGGAVALEYDKLGRLVARTTAAGRLAWGYDADGQVVSVGRAGSAPLRYDYDADGHLRSVEHPALGRRLLDRDADGRPVIPGRTVHRDSAGRIVQIDHDDTRLRFSYDPAGRRITADGPAGTVRYHWDPAGRLADIHHSPTGETSAPGRTTRLAVDALGAPLQINGVPVLWDPVTWPGQVHQLGTATYARAGSAIGVIDGELPEGRPGQAGQSRWIDSDWQGSPGSYDPWGLPIPSSSNSPTGSPDEPVTGLGYHGELAVDGLLWQRARVLDPATRSFLSPDPLDHLPGMPAAANPYHYAWNDPVGLLDPTGLRPLSDDEYNTYRTQAAKGMFDKAWDNIGHDPWGSLAAAVIGAGVGLMFVPGGQVIGTGILIGAGTSAGIGLVTGHVSPRSIAVSGMLGGATGGIGDALGGATAAGADIVGADATAVEDAGAAFKTVFRFHDASDPTSLVSRLESAAPDVQAKVMSQLESPAEVARLAEAHMQGFVENSPFVSVTDSPEAAAATTDWWLQGIVKNAPHLSEFSVPASRLVAPSNALSISEGEYLFQGDDLIKYLVETRANPFRGGWRMLSPKEYPDVLVTVAHPWGNLEVPLEAWIQTGPGPRPYVGIVAARRSSTGCEVPLAEIPHEYHNSPETRSLQRQGLLPCPWGPPPKSEP